MVIKLEDYKKNKNIINDIRKIQKFFIKEYPRMNSGWVGVTALFFSQASIVDYLKSNKIDPRFKPALKAILWNFLNEISNIKEEIKGNGHE